jgi:hypothetical protein
MISRVVTEDLIPRILNGDSDDLSGRIENNLPSLRLMSTLPSFWADSNTDENFCRASLYVNIFILFP